jgi:hypothetical protein
MRWRAFKDMRAAAARREGHTLFRNSGDVADTIAAIMSLVR